MLGSFIKTAFRNLWTNKAFSVINIMGLALGLACSLLIMLWVNDEYHVDAFHKNGKQLYSIYEQQYRDNGVNAFYGSPGLLADEMKRVLPDVQFASNYGWGNLTTFEANNKVIKESGNYAGQDFFKMFSYPLLAGNAASALVHPLDIVISKKMASEFFGSPIDAIGKTIRCQNSKDYKITAVFDDLPKNSTAQFDYMMTWQAFLKVNDWATDWTNNGPSCYIMLRPGTDPKQFGKKIRRFLDNYNKGQTSRSYIRLGMARYSDVYLHSNFDKNGNVSGGKIQYVTLFSIVAIFILLIACVNFMNLTTARSIKRAKEIGVRKVIGAGRFTLIRQFMSEAMFIVLVAIVIALVIVAITLPKFNELTQKEIYIPFAQFEFWPGIAALLFLTGFISGSYPALYLSSFRPIGVLKGALKFSGSAVWFRKGLVVFQFVLSIVLIVSTIVVGRQVNYIQTMNLGYDRANLIYLPLEGDLIKNYEIFKNKAIQSGTISEVTRTDMNPTHFEDGTGGVSWPGKDPNADIEFSYAEVGYDFAKTMHASIASGRDFSEEFPSDSVGYVLNEEAVKTIGYKEPVGKSLTFWGKEGIIIGVLKDFHFASVHTPIGPLVLRLDEHADDGQALIRTQPGKTKQAIANLSAICRDLNPKFPFTYIFSDEEYAKLYASESVITRLANYFAFLAIFISCLGLLGLAIFTAEQRKKEFGIRKVLGAGPLTLVSLLSREFIVLVLIALVIASPLAWIAMKKWLQDYVYGIHLSWWMFAIAGIAAIFIALITVSFQAIRSAMSNPVKSLRSE